KKIGAYVAYKEEGTFKKSNTHKNISPFVVEVDTTHNQITGVELEIRKIDDRSFAIIPLTATHTNYLYNYSKDLNISKNVGVKFPEKGNFGEWISGKHFRFKISKGKIKFNPEDKYSFVLTNLDVATARVKRNISVAPMSKGSS